jgi:hypothetical protein
MTPVPSMTSLRTSSQSQSASRVGIIAVADILDLPGLRAFDLEAPTGIFDRDAARASTAQWHSYRHEAEAPQNEYRAIPHGNPDPLHLRHPHRLPALGWEDELTVPPLEPFLDLRRRLAHERIGDGGLDTCAALSKSLDSALGELAVGVGSDAAVVALGGYGREEQCLWSDVDLMLLHRGGDPEPLIRRILYPLWDANLKVGHAVRTIAESRDAGLERLETLTSLLSARLVAGDEELFADLMATISDLVRTRPLSSRLVAQEGSDGLSSPTPP